MADKCDSCGKILGGIFMQGKYTYYGDNDISSMKFCISCYEKNFSIKIDDSLKISKKQDKIVSRFELMDI